ncbi:hypothetical protein V6N11_076499 [Hibiscus sabdariffa]|uniref:Uncharacterized protein n=1 Tax=Hibiscus sabdariffa TaxID=183260 RepID=A0ABR2Q6R9_9ROSI
MECSLWYQSPTMLEPSSSAASLKISFVALHACFHHYSDFIFESTSLSNAFWYQFIFADDPKVSVLSSDVVMLSDSSSPLQYLSWIVILFRLCCCQVVLLLRRLLCHYRSDLVHRSLDLLTSFWYQMPRWFG